MAITTTNTFNAGIVEETGGWSAGVHDQLTDTYTKSAIITANSTPTLIAFPLQTDALAGTLAYQKVHHAGRIHQNIVSGAASTGDIGGAALPPESGSGHYLAWEGLFRNAFGTLISVTGTDISASQAASIMTIAKVAADLPVSPTGGMAKVSGFTNAENNGVFPILTTGAASWTVLNPNGVTEAAGASVSIDGLPIEDGDLSKSYLYEREIGGRFYVFPGTQFSGGNFTIPGGGTATFNYSLMANTPLVSSATTISAASYDSGFAQAPFHGASKFHVWYGDSVYTKWPVQSISLNWSGLVEQLKDIVGFRGPAATKNGLYEPSFSITLKHDTETRDIYDDWLNSTDRRIGFSVEDAAGNIISMNMPSCTVENGNFTVPGPNSDIPITLNGVGKYNSTHGASLFGMFHNA